MPLVMPYESIRGFVVVVTQRKILLELTKLYVYFEAGQNFECSGASE